MAKLIRSSIAVAGVLALGGLGAGCIGVSQSQGGKSIPAADMGLKSPGPHTQYLTDPLQALRLIETVWPEVEGEGTIVCVGHQVPRYHGVEGVIDTDNSCQRWDLEPVGPEQHAVTLDAGHFNLSQQYRQIRH